MDKLSLGLEVLNQLNKAGFEAYIVGGAVRDYLLDRKIEDIDITTSADVDTICFLFKEYNLDASNYFGVKIYYKGCTFEITSFRKDIEYLDHRHPVVVKAKALKEDLVRRDFTMNAMVLDKDKNIIDIFNGQLSIKEKKIICIGNPDVRFDEDALRVLRVLYFSSKLDFVIDDEIIQSIVNYDYVSYLPKEYIKSMLQKIVSFDSKRGLKYIVELNILKSFPFYQVLAEECYKYGVNSDEMLALFYTLHGFLPENERITREENKKAKLIGTMIRNNFDSVNLYKSKGLYIEEAERLFNKIYNSNINDIKKRYLELPIHSSRDISFDFSNTKCREIQREIEFKILNGEIENDEEDIFYYIQMRS